MIPVSDKDISRIFGNAYLKEQKRKGHESFYLYKKREGASLLWFIMSDKSNRKSIVRRIRSNIILGKILGVEDKFEQEYDTWINILAKTKNKEKL